MSVEPFLMYSTCGISSTALQLARSEYVPCGISYSSRLTACLPLVQANTYATATAPAASTQPQGCQSTRAASSTTMHLSMKAVSAAQVSSMTNNKHAAPRARAACTSNQMDSSKLFMPDNWGAGCNIDFEAIADSSVGGGGLPRPYGRFAAARSGNGTAIWERLPLSTLTIEPKATSARAHYENGSSTTKQHGKNVANSPGGRTGGRSVDAAKWRGFASATMAPPRLLNPLKHAEPVLAERAGVALPPATFLTEVASSVPGIVRVDGGYNCNRDFLRAGLNSGAHPAPGAVTAAAAAAWPLNAAAAPHEDVIGMTAPEEELELHRQPSGQSVVAAAAPEHYSSSVRRKDASAIENQLSETLMRRADAAAASGRDLAGSLDGTEGDAGESASLFILSALSGANKQALTVSVAPCFATESLGARRRGLPDELGLPRRSVPTFGR